MTQQLMNLCFEVPADSVHVHLKEESDFLVLNVVMPNGKVKIRLEPNIVGVAVEGYTQKSVVRDEVVEVDLRDMTDEDGAPVVRVWDNTEQYIPSQTISLRWATEGGMS